MEDNISLGGMLSSLRSNMGLTQDDIASRIHVRTAVVDEIENDLPVHAPLVFIKGYIRAYAEIVGLPVEEYKAHLDKLSKHYESAQKANRIPRYKRKKSSKKLLFIFLLILSCVVGATVYYINKQNKNNYVEVSHYISPSLAESDRVKS